MGRRPRAAMLVKALALLAVVSAGVFYYLTRPATILAEAFTAHTPDLKNGETMYNAGGCASCHATTGQDDKLRLGGGLEMKTDFGTFHAPNISSDPVHGIGAWTEQDFANAILRGVGRQGEHLYPSFPYASYQRMSLTDVRDLYAFMRMLPADPKPSLKHDLPFPFNVRRGLGLWKLAYLDGKPFQPSPAHDAIWNRGAYLVEGPGHCAECHSTRDLLGGIITESRFAGGPDPERKGWIANITPHADGLENWSAADIAELLATGFTPEYDSVGGTMADVVANTAKLSAEDRAAMAAYLKALPARPGKRPAS